MTGLSIQLSSVGVDACCIFAFRMEQTKIFPKNKQVKLQVKEVSSFD